MKGLVQFINEAVNTTAIVNNIKKEFQKEFGDKVTIGSGRANYQQLYDVYIYDMDISTLKKVNGILKKHITIWKGFTDEEMQKKLDDKKEFFDKHKDDKYVSLDRYPVEFFRFTSRDLQKMLKESMIDEAITKLTTPFETLCKVSNTDASKEVWVLTRHVKNNFMKLKRFNNGEEAEAYVDTLRDGKSEDGYFQALSNSEDDLKKMMKMGTFRKYKKVFESCGQPEHKIVKDAAGNWRIKGTPGKGANTDKEGLWAAKYKTEEDAKKALAAYHAQKHEALSETRYHAHKNESLNEAKKYFVLEDDERRALADCIGIMLGNIGEDEEIAVYKEFKDGLSKEEVEQYDSLYDCLENTEDYKKINRNNIIDDLPLIKKLYSWMQEKDMLQEQWDLIDAFEKIKEN